MSPTKFPDVTVKYIYLKRIIKLCAFTPLSTRKGGKLTHPFIFLFAESDSISFRFCKLWPYSEHFQLALKVIADILANDTSAVDTVIFSCSTIFVILLKCLMNTKLLQMKLCEASHVSTVTKQLFGTSFFCHKTRMKSKHITSKYLFALFINYLKFLPKPIYKRWIV